MNTTLESSLCPGEALSKIIHLAKQMGYHGKATPTVLVRRHCKNISHVTHTQDPAYTRVQKPQSDAKFGYQYYKTIVPSKLARAISQHYTISESAFL